MADRLHNVVYHCLCGFEMTAHYDVLSSYDPSMMRCQNVTGCGRMMRPRFIPGWDHASKINEAMHVGSIISRGIP